MYAIRSYYALVPQALLSCRQAIRLSLEHSRRDIVEPARGKGPESWAPESTFPVDAVWAGGTFFFECRRVILEGTPEEVWEPIRRIGGDTGWYYADWLWRLRVV